MTVSDDRMKRILEFDALSEAEKLTGADCYEDAVTQNLGVGMFLVNAAIKQQELCDRQDTRWSMDYLEYLSIVTDLGFEVIKIWDIAQEDDRTEQVLFLWHKETGVPLVFDTYKGYTNSAHIYGNWIPNDPEHRCRYTSTGCWSAIREDVWCGEWDAREAFRFQFEQLCKHGTFVSPWVDMEWPAFRPIVSQDYPKDMEWEEKKRVVEEIARQRFKTLPADIQECLVVACKEKV
jgi:hypothetical protein